LRASCYKGVQPRVKVEKRKRDMREEKVQHRLYRSKPVELPIKKYEIKAPLTPTETNGETPIRKRIKKEKQLRRISEFCQLCGEIHQENDEHCRISKMSHPRPSMTDLISFKSQNDDKTIRIDKISIEQSTSLLSEEITTVKRCISPFDITMETEHEALSNILLAKALSAFMQHLVRESISQKGDQESILAPLHVYKAACKNSEFAFLNNPNQ
jgi:hypothetical protein